MPVRKECLTLARRRDETGGRLRRFQRVVHTGEIDRIFAAAAQHGCFIVGAAGTSPLRRDGSLPITARMLRMKHDGCTAHGCPSHCLRITPAFMTRDDAEPEAV